MHPTDEVMPADLDYRAAAAEVRCSRMAIVAAVLGFVGTPVFLLLIFFWHLSVEGFDEWRKAPAGLVLLRNFLTFVAILVPLALSIISARRISTSDGRLTGMGFAGRGALFPAFFLGLVLLGFFFKLLGLGVRPL